MIFRLFFRPLMARQMGLALALLLSACGAHTDSAGSLPKIVGGSAVTTRDPVEKSTVALLQPNGWQFCSGSLIGKRLVLTAAHCLVDYQDKQLLIAFGPEATMAGKRPATLRHAAAYATNQDYDLRAIQSVAPSTPPNDVALVMLAADAPAGYAPVTLLKLRDHLRIGEALTLAGFGLTAATGGTAGVLRKVVTTLRSLDSDAREFEFGDTPGKSSCMGDSGGPAFVKRAGHLRLAGVTSRGAIGCIGEGIYTDLRYFHPWIARAQGAMLETDAAKRATAKDVHVVLYDRAKD